jgi:hypothetical protein
VERRECSISCTKTLGIEGGPAENKFLTGILIVTSVSKSMFRMTQEVVQADGAHTSFGKYTLFSAYTTTANGNMANIAFGTLFGNEDTKNWTVFWNFLCKVNPTINCPQVTLMTDQDKVSIKSVQECIPEAFNFHCSYHRRENINKYWKTSHGTVVILPSFCMQQHAATESRRTKVHPTVASHRHAISYQGTR